MSKEIHFLLIDDDEDDREFFQFALEDINRNIGYTGVESGYDALHLLKNGPQPDYIFLDLNMPGMSGRECLMELKKDRVFSHIPVIIFSTSSDPYDREETKKLGAIDFITKPTKTSELVKSLNTFLSNHLSPKI
ncbi:response regulator [Cytophaga hutchinsonii]|jgi:CheY-like chemotaxis protein|uniref:CheY-like response regulator n=1 Tax=Cytophaga hutchinsonii (strain ATCC 33406 / DSM 1761 / CIP 103989 / NBRC 15051 / NCIMB 9469 / D465) TaxID=269798 RepID=A0A6N4SQC9_CYTH3|nr:response regulator [Cytophaga hutchinsonii]ABG58493.1 CheY-like response regulator [Cytophaga hutchinsonii ATCC 33406]SFX75621.1 CheY chemotaxis protein or a CheY-like REC (receiver) domain [Cytophaga hutchinsonii ATCC 33406]